MGSLAMYTFVPFASDPPCIMSYYRRPPMDIEHLAKGIKVVKKDVCISEEGGAVPCDPRLDA